MNKRIATALAVAGSFLLGPAALAAAAEPASAPAYDLESVDGILDHGQGDQADDHDDDSKDDHDHDGDGRPDHDPEDHDDDDKPKDDDD
jgi:hypothetical protein